MFIVALFIIREKEPKGTSMENGHVQLLSFLSLAFLSQFLSQRGNLPSAELTCRSYGTWGCGQGSLAPHGRMSTEEPSTKWPEWSVSVSVQMVEGQHALTRLRGQFGPAQSERCSGIGGHGFWAHGRELELLLPHVLPGWP